MAKIAWEEMLPHEFIAAREAAPVAYLAIGPLEWHSLHLPLGNDPMKAIYYLRKVAERVGGVVHPALYFATNSANRDDLPLKSEAYGHELFEKVVEAKLDFIAANRFRVILVMNGHGGQLYFVRQAAERVAAKYGITIFSTQDEMHSAPGLYVGDHAGGEETSMLMHMRPDLVDLSRLPPLPEPLDNNKLVIHSPRPDPRTQSSADYGRESCRLIIDNLCVVVRDLLAGKAVPLPPVA